MRRTRKLPAVNTVSHLETHHAYISPPIPEKGGLPTIIVTPAEASAISEFEIHFYSPRPTQPTFQSSQGFLPRVRSFFQRSTPIPPTQALLEKAQYFDEEDVTEARKNIPRIVVTNGDYQMLTQDDNDEVLVDPIPGVPTISEEQWSNISASETGTGPIALPISGHAHTLGHGRLITRRVRTLLFLSVPVALMAFHLITHQMGMFRADGVAGFWSEESMHPTPIGGPSL